MKKILLLHLVLALSVNLIAQKNKPVKDLPATTSSSFATDVAPPPPPPPPPPKPPVPPPPPAPPEKVKFTPPVIVNNNGYDLSVHYNNGVNMIYAKKDGKTEKIPMEKWNANQSFYENKYGKLPPPPPPPPAPPAPPSI